MTQRQCIYASCTSRVQQRQTDRLILPRQPAEALISVYSSALTLLNRVKWKPTALLCQQIKSQSWLILKIPCVWRKSTVVRSAFWVEGGILQRLDLLSGSIYSLESLQMCRFLLCFSPHFMFDHKKGREKLEIISLSPTTCSFEGLLTLHFWTKQALQ